jgi:Uma2 family endonuclease
MTAFQRDHRPADDTPRFATVEAFMAHEFGDDLPRELIDGIAVAHAAPSSDHGGIAANLTRALGNALEAAGSPCRVETGSGIRPRRRRFATHRIPDVLIRCPQSDKRPEDQPVVAVFEVLSPSNTAAEMEEKSLDYKSVPSIRQIVHLRQDQHACSWLRRAGDLWISEEAEGPESVLVVEGGISIPLAEIYRHVLTENGEQMEVPSKAVPTS